MTTISIKKIPNGKWKENCYVVSNFKSEALIIDPGGEEKQITGFIGDNKLTARAIINTHAHYDHIGAINRVKDKYSIPFFLHSRDEKLLKSANLYKTIFDGSGIIKIPEVDHYFDGIELRDYLSDFSIDVIFTPGHTGGSVCFLIDNCLFTGDTLFNGEVGRVDLPGGDEAALRQSLKIISELPNQTIIYPGHGNSSTIEHELEHNNSFIQALLT